MKSKLRNNWLQIPWAARCTIVVSAVVITFYSVENFRGWYALKKYCEYWEAKGEWFDLADKPEVEIKPGETNLLDYVAVKNLIADPDSFEFRKIDVELHGEMTIANRKNWRNSQLFPFVEVFSPDQTVPRSIAAKIYLDKIAHWTEKLDLLTAAIHDADVIKPELPDPLINRQIPYGAPFIRAAKTLDFRARAKIATKNADGACDDICTLIRLSKMLIHDEATMIDLLVAYTLQHTALTPIWEGLKQRKWNEPHLARFAAHFPQVPMDTIPHATFQLERMQILEAIRTLDSFSERISNPEIFTTYTSFGLIKRPDIPDSIPFESELEDIITRTLFCICPNGWYDLWTLKICKEMRGAMQFHEEFVTLPFYTRILPIPADLNAGYEAVQNRLIEAKSNMALAATAVAVERYQIANQRYPANLKDLVPEFLSEMPSDIYSGKPLIYIPAGVRSDRPVIYSIGANQKDDNGYPFLNRKGDIAWQYSLPGGFSIQNYENSEIPNPR